MKIFATIYAIVSSFVFLFLVVNGEDIIDLINIPFKSFWFFPLVAFIYGIGMVGFIFNSLIIIALFEDNKEMLKEGIKYMICALLSVIILPIILQFIEGLI